MKTGTDIDQILDKRPKHEWAGIIDAALAEARREGGLDWKRRCRERLKDLLLAEHALAERRQCLRIVEEVLCVEPPKPVTWCEHISLNKMCPPVKDCWVFKEFHDSTPVDADDWNICPMKNCGAKRPEEAA